MDIGHVCTIAKARTLVSWDHICIAYESVDVKVLSNNKLCLADCSFHVLLNYLLAE